MNMPKRASRHHCMRASRWAGVSVSWMAGTGWLADSGRCAALELGVAEGGGDEEERGGDAAEGDFQGTSSGLIDGIGIIGENNRLLVQVKKTGRRVSLTRG